MNWDNFITVSIFCILLMVLIVGGLTLHDINTVDWVGIIGR